MIPETKRERRHQRTQQAILEAALAIVHEQGIAGLSIRAIADRIDYSPAGLYEYYGSKEEIIQALVQEGFRRLTLYLQQVDTSLPTLEQLVQCGLSYIDFARKNRDFFMLIFTTAPLASPQVECDVDAAAKEEALAELRSSPAFAELWNKVDRCVCEGIFQSPPGQDTTIIALNSWALVHGIAMLRVTMPGLPDSYADDRVMLEALHRGLLASR